MAMTQQIPPGYSTGALARFFGVAVWQVRRLVERGLLPEPPRVGMYRVFLPEQLPIVREALIKAGYLQAEVPA
jgi:DNA-binding transcriptional MerR regulator